jgi:lipopolysaccharide assembly protein A
MGEAGLGGAICLQPVPMAFLKTLFWIVLTIAIVLFFMHNWTPTTINLFGDLVWETKLPVPLMLAFLLGFAPLYAWHRAALWRNRRRAAAALAATAATPAPVPAVAVPAAIDPSAPAADDVPETQP